MYECLERGRFGYFQQLCSRTVRENLDIMIHPPSSVASSIHLSIAPFATTIWRLWDHFVTVIFRRHPVTGVKQPRSKSTLKNWPRLQSTRLTKKMISLRYESLLLSISPLLLLIRYSSPSYNVFAKAMQFSICSKTRAFDVPPVELLRSTLAT